MTSDSFLKSSLKLALVVLVVAALYLAKGVLLPLTLAILLSFLLSPVCAWLERRGMGRISSVVLTAFLGFTLMGAAGWTAVSQLTDLAPRLPEYQANVAEKFKSVNQVFATAMTQVSRTSELSASPPTKEEASFPIGTRARPFAVRVLSAPVSPLQMLSGTTSSLFEGIGTAGIVAVLVIFFLIGREDLRDRFILLMGKNQVTMTTQMLEDAGTRVSSYLSTLFVLNVAFGAAITLGLTFIGVPSAILWGVLAGLLRFIPYLGPWMAAAMPIGLSLAVSTGWTMPLLAAGLFVCVELLSNNVVEPWVYGQNTGLSPVAVVIAAVFWTWLWGVVGLLVAIPVTVCLMVVGKHIPQLAFLNILLGNEPVFEPQRRVYQRLLAGDLEEASEVVEADLANRPLIEVYDTLLIPALALAQVHWHRDELEEDRHAFILNSLKELIHDQAGSPTELEPSDEAPSEFRGRIICLPASDEADAIAVTMLAQVLGTDGCRVHASPMTPTDHELTDLVERCRADLICISATPPAAVVHARHLSKQLRARFPHLPIVVGLWNTSFDLGKAKARIGGGDYTLIVSTLAAAREEVRRRLPLPLPKEVVLEITVSSTVDGKEIRYSE